MPVDTLHDLYTSYQDKWQRCRDAYDGEDAVKSRGTAYLPQLSGQSNNDYDAYKLRADYYGATKRTISGLTGAVMRIDPIISDNSFAERAKDITGTGISLYKFINEAMIEYLINGRYGILVDHDGSKAYFSGFKTENITNWSNSFITLKETAEQQDPTDQFVISNVDQYRVLNLSESIYTVDLYQKDGDGIWQVINTIEATKNGKPLDSIPFVGITRTGLGLDPIDPPLLDLVNINMSHYRTSADLEHGRHFTALPTPYATGVDADQAELKIGSNAAWLLPDPSSKVGFLEFTGQGLKALETAMREKRDAMASLGAQMLEQKKEGVEAAQAVRLKQSSEISMLINVVKDVEIGINQALRVLSDWEGLQPVTVKINTDWIDNKLTANDLVALTKALIDGAISHDTFLWNLSTGEMLPPDRTLEEEQQLIKDDKYQEAVPGKEMKSSGNMEIDL